MAPKERGTNKRLWFYVLIAIVLAQLPSIFIFSKISEIQEAIRSYNEILALELADNTDIEFIARLKREANLSQDIQILVGPYKRLFGNDLKHNLEQHLVIVQQSETSKETFLILFKKDLYHELDGERRKAVLAHEMGHIISWVSGERRVGLNEELYIDNYASRYVRPEILISLYEQYEGDDPSRIAKIKNLERQLPSKTVGGQ